MRSLRQDKAHSTDNKNREEVLKKPLAKNCIKEQHVAKDVIYKKYLNDTQCNSNSIKTSIAAWCCGLKIYKLEEDNRKPTIDDVKNSRIKFFGISERFEQKVKRIISIYGIS